MKKGFIIAGVVAAVVFVWYELGDRSGSRDKDAPAVNREASVPDVVTVAPAVSEIPSMESALSLGMELDGMEQDRLQRVQELAGFIAAQMTGAEGIYTNWSDTEQSGEAATGHEVLSESASLMLRYLALSGMEQQFEDVWQTARRTLDQETSFSYRYSPRWQKRYSMNAAVDDLRMIRALYEAGQLLGNPVYTHEAERYGRRFYTYNVQDGYMYDFYDEAYGVKNRFVTLCYIDLLTLERMADIRSAEADWHEEPRLVNEVASNMLNIAKGGYITDLFPFYETRYNYESDRYESEGIGTVESLLTILALAEVDEHQAASIEYIREHVQQGTLYGKYTREGIPLTDVQSTAIYAIAAMIGAVIGDGSLYEAGIERMEAFRVDDADSPLYGGFGNAATGVAYSFDNLMALLAYVY